MTGTTEIPQIKIQYMTVGKYAGTPIDELPDSFLSWAVNNCSFRTQPELMRLLEEELFARIADGTVDMEKVPRKLLRLSTGQTEMLRRTYHGPVTPTTEDEAVAGDSLQALHLVRKYESKKTGFIRYFSTATGDRWVEEYEKGQKNAKQ